MSQFIYVKGSPLAQAARYNKLHIARQLVDTGANSSIQLQSAWSPLRIAIKFGFMDVAQFLAKKHEGTTVALSLVQLRSVLFQ